MKVSGNRNSDGNIFHYATVVNFTYSFRCLILPAATLSTYCCTYLVTYCVVGYCCEQQHSQGMRTNMAHAQPVLSSAQPTLLVVVIVLQISLVYN